MAVLTRNDSNVTTFSVSVPIYGTVTIDVLGRNLLVDTLSQEYVAGTITGLIITTSTGVISTTVFGRSDIGAIPDMRLPVNTIASIEDFMAKIGAESLVLNETGTFALFRDFSTDLSVFGTQGDDQLVTGSGDDLLVGDAGNDTLFGGDGDNTLFGGEGDDFLTTGSAYIFSPTAFEGANTFYAGAGDDDIYGNDGDELIFAGSGDDFAILDGGDDTAYGQGGGDGLYGGNGDDSIFGGGGGDWVSGGQSLRYEGEEAQSDNDLLKGGGGADQVFGGLGNDSLFGGRGSDALDGGRGADLLRGGNGRDAIKSLYRTDEDDADNGGSAKVKDKLFGGKGDDIFIFSESQEGRALVRDFKQGRDALQLMPDVAVSLFPEAEVDAIITARDQFKTFMDGASQKKNGVLFEGDRGSIMIRDLELDDLSAADFVTIVSSVIYYD